MNGCCRNDKARRGGLWEGLGGEFFSGRVEAFLLTLEGEGSSGPHGMLHTGQEFVYCVQGKLEYQVESQIFTMETGDSLLFAAQLRHSWRNPGGMVTNALILITDHAEADRGLDLHWGEDGSSEDDVVEEEV